MVDANILEVQIRGWDGAENRNDVVAFLLRKFGVQVQNPRFQGQYLYCTAPNPAAYQTLINATGVRFAGKALLVQPSQNRPGPAAVQTGFSSQHTKTTYEILKGFLSSRYNPEIGLLDLSNLASDDTLQGAGFFSSATTQAKVFARWMSLIAVISGVDESCTGEHTEARSRGGECQSCRKRITRRTRS
jgi:RNA recognition motif